MASNTLDPGAPRLGWFIDGNPETDHTAVMLQDTGSTIELSIPLKGAFQPKGPYDRWWSDGVHYGDDPDRKRFSYKPPRIIAFNDEKGSVVLIGCRPAGYSQNPTAGRGRIIANYAILGAKHLRYASVNGIRTNIPAIAKWTQFSSLETTRTVDDTNRLQSITATLTTSDPIQLSRRLNLKLRTSWTATEKERQFTAQELVEIETRVRRPRSWDKHLDIHGALLELVSIASWTPAGIKDVHVLHNEDPLRSMAGSVIDERWLPVATYRLPRHSETTSPLRFLFPYDEVGPTGINRWLRIREVYRGTFGPLYSILRSEVNWSTANLVQSGIALESLGYRIETIRNEGKRFNNRNQLSFRTCLEIILEDMRVKPLNDTEDWIKRSRDAYISAKHPSTSKPDILEQLNVLRENILILRFWLGLKLGVKPKTILELLEFDPLSSPLVMAT